jgi:hypothetical protein
LHAHESGTEPWTPARVPGSGQRCLRLGESRTTAAPTSPRQGHLMDRLAHSLVSRVGVGAELLSLGVCLSLRALVPRPCPSQCGSEDHSDGGDADFTPARPPSRQSRPAFLVTTFGLAAAFLAAWMTWRRIDSSPPRGAPDPSPPPAAGSAASVVNRGTAYGLLGLVTGGARRKGAA